MLSGEVKIQKSSANKQDLLQDFVSVIGVVVSSLASYTDDLGSFPRSRLYCSLCVAKHAS